MTENQNPKPQGYGTADLGITLSLSAIVLFVCLYILPQAWPQVSPRLPLFVPLVAGFCLALGNIRYIGAWNTLLLPPLFGLGFALSFTGVILMMQGQEGGKQLWLDLLVEQLPALAGSYVLYRGYAMFTGQANMLIGLLVIGLGQVAAILLFKGAMEIAQLQLVFYTLTNTVLSLLHWGQDKN